MDVAILDGMCVYYNFTKHSGTNGMTPADASLIEVDWKNEWKTIIQNAIATRKSSCKTLTSIYWNRSQIVKKTVCSTKDLTLNQILERVNVLRPACALHEFWRVAIVCAGITRYESGCKLIFYFL